MQSTEIVQYLNFLVRSYEGVTHLIAATKQRLCSLPGVETDQSHDTLLKGEEKTDGLLTVQGRITRAIEKEINHTI